MGFDAEIKVRLSLEEKAALERIAAGRRGNIKTSVIVREAIQDYLERSSQVLVDKIGQAAKAHTTAKKTAQKNQAARKRAA